EGILAKILVPAGTQDVAVNEVIALIAGEGEDVASVAATGGSAASAPKEAAPVTAPAATTPAPTAPSAPQAPIAEVAHGTKVFASPLAKRIAKDAGVDISKIAGSGPHGRVIERDVKAALAGGTAPRATSASTSASVPSTPLAVGMADSVVKQLFEAGSYEEVPHDSMRKTIARRLLESKQTVPHFYVTADIELDALLKAREEINANAPKGADGKPAYKLSVNDFVIKALAAALMRVPEANVTWTEGSMLKHKHADVGVAVSIPGGLITPVIRKADLKSLSAISNEMKDLAARARNRKLKPEEYQGGTTAVSNLGMFGVKQFAAIVNPPHATILAVGAGEQRPVVKNGQLTVATVMTVTFSTDHRAVDGALGAELLSALKG
ncbi:MAG: pyruvate dehydrogenase complex dihydrolipoamide acetyltransferase, partial [Alphaproteobacteria bacterium]|nr:pyruvate dehydrogenase complex dihydrolipoamide acetyltransferase [Alphaproteobacteria bacterium]